MSAFTDFPMVLSSSQMREADRHTIQEIGIPGFTLMESAGREVAEVAQEMIELASTDTGRDTVSKRVLCLCGKGNNGGDGFVVARYLSGYGHQVNVVTMANPEEYVGEAKQHLDILFRLTSTQPVTIQSYESIDTLSAGFGADFSAGSGPAPGPGAAPELIVDALLGTGLQSEVRPDIASVIGWMNEKSSPILSVDIPSGLSADSGLVLGTAVQAHVTVTLGALKSGLLLNEGPDHVGALHVVDIGLPSMALNQTTKKDACFLSSDRGVASKLPEAPKRNDHKYTSGPTLVVGGSPSYVGAPVLTSMAAARTGSKYVICIGPHSIEPTLKEKLTEIPVESWDAPGTSNQIDALIDRLDTRWTKAKSMVIGPGLGRAQITTDLVKHVLARFDRPSVIDADALYALKNERDWVRAHSKGRWVFTPHDGEFIRLVAGSYDPSKPLAVARDFAKSWDVILLLKGHPSITVFPSGEVVFNSTGSAAAGTAGSGDVLAGVIGGLLAQGVEPGWAAVTGIHLAGTAADLYVEERSSRSLMAGDIIEWLPQALQYVTFDVPN